MSIIATIKAAHLTARKARNGVDAALYSTLLGDIQIVGKNNGNRETTESEAISVIKKFIANAKETLAISPVPDAVQVEINLLEALLPKQLTEQELKNLISNLISCYNATSIKDMGKIMKKLKEDFDGHYDGTLASKIIKEQLNVNL